MIRSSQNKLSLTVVPTVHHTKYNKHNSIHGTELNSTLVMLGLAKERTTHEQEKKLDVAEMRILRWWCGVTTLDRIRDEIIRGTTKVGRDIKESSGK